MSKTKRRLIIGTIAVLLIGGIVWLVRGKKPVTTYTTADVERGDLTQTVSVTGDLLSESEVTLNFEIGGRIKDVFVKVGDKIAQGEMVAMIEDVILSKQLEQARAGLEQALAVAGGSNDSLREAKVARDNAENVLEKTENVSDQNMQSAEKAVDNAQNYYDDAKSYYDKVVADSGADSSQAKAAKLTLTTAENSLNGAKEALKVANEQADLSKVNAEGAVETSKARIKTIESKYSEASRDATVAAARAAYELALANLDKAALKSPVSGTITEVNNKKGEILGTGVIKEAFSRVMSNDFVIESKVPESDIVKIKKGQSATVTFDAFALSDQFEGEVIEIDPASTVVQDVVYYTIKLRLKRVDERLKPGMSANVDISTAKQENVLKVPLRAIKTEGLQKFVEILLADSTIQKVLVETGLEGDQGMVEIKSGLKGGEKVVTFVTTK